MQRFGRLVSLLILILIASILYSTLKGFFFRSTPIWNFEVSLFLFGSFFMLGAAYCHMEKKHVAVDVLTHYLPPKWQRYQAIVCELVVIAVVLTILWASVPPAWRSTLMRERSTHQTPFNPQIWWFRWIIPISCGLISWQAFRHLISLIFSRPDTPSGAESK